MMLKWGQSPERADFLFMWYYLMKNGTKPSLASWITFFRCFVPMPLGTGTFRHFHLLRVLLGVLTLATEVISNRSSNSSSSGCNSSSSNSSSRNQIPRWLTNPGGTTFLKPIKYISQEESNACLHVSTHLRMLQLQESFYEIRTNGDNVHLLRFVPNSKTSINVPSHYASRC